MFHRVFALLLASCASASALAASCEATIDSTDQMTFSTQVMEVSKQCKTFTVNLTHSGSLPKQVMGHNWVLSRKDDMAGVAQAGMSEGVEQSYLKPGDARVLAWTPVIGGGEKTTVTFDVSQLDPAQAYSFFCSVPGHIGMMNGELKRVD